MKTQALNRFRNKLANNSTFLRALGNTRIGKHHGDGRRPGKEQVEDYAKLKNRSVKETERWLSPNLGYSNIQGSKVF